MAKSSKVLFSNVKHIVCIMISGKIKSKYLHKGSSSLGRGENYIQMKEIGHAGEGHASLAQILLYITG